MDVFAGEPGKFQCSGLSREQSEALLRAAVGLIAVPVEPDALNAILRLCLRLTRTFHEAALFAELGGIKLLLALTQASSFAGFSSLASLLVRHVLEDEQVRLLYFIVPQIDPSVPQPVVQSRRRPLLGPSPG